VKDPWRGCPLTAPVVVLTISLWFACSRQNVPAPPDAAAQLQTIPAADPAKYPALEEHQHWSNPYLVIRLDSVGLLSGTAANEEQVLKPSAVLPALAHLPQSAWPYGRVVAILVEGKANASEEEKIVLRRMRGIVAGDLEGAHVAIYWISS